MQKPFLHASVFRSITGTQSCVAHAVSKVEGHTAKRDGFFNAFHPTVFIKLGDITAVLCVQSRQGNMDPTTLRRGREQWIKIGTKGCNDTAKMMIDGVWEVADSLAKIHCVREMQALLIYACTESTAWQRPATLWPPLPRIPRYCNPIPTAKKRWLRKSELLSSSIRHALYILHLLRLSGERIDPSNMTSLPAIQELPRQ